MYREAVKEGTFLHDYLQYMDPVETPLGFDFWTGIWLISCALGRNMVINRPEAPVFMNVYAVLCADAGATRKSSAIRRCEAIYREAKLHEHNAIITGPATPEALVHELGVRSHEGRSASLHILISELVTFLGREQYTIALPGLLTDLYDCPALREGKRVGATTYPIRNAYVTLLAASTSSWLVRAINPDVIEGGFTSRCLFIVEERRKRLVAWPELRSDAAERRAACVQSLNRIKMEAERWSKNGIDLSDAARARFIQWYEQRRCNSDDPFIASFEAREDHHVLRLAGLLSANDGSYIVTPHHLSHAIRLVDHCKRSAATIFSPDRKAAARLVAGIDKLRTVLVEAGELGLAQSDITYRVRNFLKNKELEYALAIMHELEMVQRFDVATTGRTKVVWRATNKILARNLNNLLNERLTS